eukprot:gb/GFBE01079727.1/.p1 GENE.gb/GFBE01079727.1/~~gb/GFBE01079727.1/.p1  ORF type:complete len:233 (+),score=36.74 gb/GFBE01079727.1/:1-699(+)
MQDNRDRETSPLQVIVRNTFVDIADESSSHDVLRRSNSWHSGQSSESSSFGGMDGAVDIASSSNSSKSHSQDAEDGLPSVGSNKHAIRTCTPCTFFGRGNCKHGYECRYCHVATHAPDDLASRPSSMKRKAIKNRLDAIERETWDEAKRASMLLEIASKDGYSARVVQARFGDLDALEALAASSTGCKVADLEAFKDMVAAGSLESRPPLAPGLVSGAASSMSLEQDNKVSL